MSAPRFRRASSGLSTGRQCLNLIPGEQNALEEAVGLSVLRLRSSKGMRGNGWRGGRDAVILAALPSPGPGAIEVVRRSTEDCLASGNTSAASSDRVTSLTRSIQLVRRRRPARPSWSPRERFQMKLERVARDGEPNILSTRVDRPVRPIGPPSRALHTKGRGLE